ncbi:MULTISPECIES: EamA family transporter RarD [Vitreoscilla]|uniref:EamA family transporter RarD n=1 Tax=Vitreoscilla stercoraria TaxID=61 RepID=A0ABY4EAS7_VITST|nr:MULTISPECIES: EamA family transporter RarD [Vitreoscilla]AUZ06211.1 protein RarD [Vitreoscilla sp. C1]UOO92428.1 EamA family transporter RarD [Vitreoscilla stercoraria]
MSNIHYPEKKLGLIYAISCYMIWGLFALYWYPLTQTDMPASQILAQRVIWSTVFALILMVALRQTKIVVDAIKTPKVLGVFVLSAALLGANWLIYIGAITSNHVLDASLGYFISPLFSILLGRLFFNERLSYLQVAAVGVASLGVIWLIVLYGNVPWIALGLTISFGFYSLVRKLAPLPALPGLMLETLCMLPIALLYLAFQQQQNTLYLDLSSFNWAILVGSGIITTVPLLLFAAGAKRISMTEMGIIQYISPTLQLITGLILFHETFNQDRFIGYALVWAAVILYLLSSWQKRRKA